MKLKDYTKEDLEQLTYSEIAELILTDNNNKMKIVDIFRKICQLLELSDSEFENHVADFYELITTDGHFIILDGGFCDLRKKHAPKIILEEDDDLEEASEDEEDENEDDIDDDIKEDEDDDIFYDNSSDEDDVTDDDELDDFVLVDEEETSM